MKMRYNNLSMSQNKKLKWLRKTLSIAMVTSIGIFGTIPMHTADANKRLGEDVYINAEFKETKLVDVFDALSQLSDVPIICDGELTDKVAINTNGQSLASIIDGLVKAFDLTCTEDNGIYIIGDDDADANRITKTFYVEYAELSDLQNDIKTFLNTENVSLSTNDNTITVSGSNIAIKKVEELLRIRDVKQKQVTLQAKFVELSRDDAKQLGLQFVNGNWGRLTNDKTIPWVFTYDAYLYGSKTDDTGKVLARPTVSTMNGKTATINLSDRVPILTTSSSDGNTTTTVTYQDVGVKLVVTPRVNQETGFVTMNLEPTVSSITGWTESKNVTAPNIATREVSTSVRCRSGETVIIGGLLKKDDIMAISKVPILGDLPILGRLFQYHNHQKSDTELVVMVTPIIEGWESREDHKPYFQEESWPSNLHDKATMEYLTHADRRGRDDRLPRKISNNNDTPKAQEWSTHNMEGTPDADKFIYVDPNKKSNEIREFNQAEREAQQKASESKHEHGELYDRWKAEEAKQERAEQPKENPFAKGVQEKYSSSSVAEEASR